MTAQVYSATNIGFEGRLITVECDASSGLPTLLLVGLGNKAIDEAKERVRSAIKNSQLEFLRKRVTINLAPANLPKDGAHFDLPIALALLIVSGQLPQEALRDTLVVGELALDGSLRPVRGVIGYTETALRNNLSTVIVPRANAAQAALVKGVTVLAADSLRDAYLHLRGDLTLDTVPAAQHTKPRANTTAIDDVKGQEQAKRALLIAAAGHHNILFSGPPGAGKTMLAKALTAILPPLSSDEIIEVTKLHSLVGDAYDEVVVERPFRAPHHSASHVALTGGGPKPRPGEISLAHRGVLFLDEIPQYTRHALESLRQPLEDRVISIARANDHVVYPADFMLIATQNPCPCGYLGDPQKACNCTMNQIQNYQKKLSGPLLDRFDMFIEVSRVEHATLLEDSNQATQTKLFGELVTRARQAQHARFKRSDKTNTHLLSRHITKVAHLSAQAQELLQQAAAVLHLSARSYFKVIKVARTIADIDNSATITPQHISEALQYRPRSSLNQL